VKKLLVFTGESGSGKTTLVTRLAQEYPNQFKRVITCTSRPKRVDEVEGVDYHFLPKEYFIDNPNLVLTGKISDDFHYGTRRLDLISDTHHLLLTSKITGLTKLVGLGFKNIVAVRISISEEMKAERMRQRGDTDGMIAERLLLDVISRREVDLGNIPIINLDAGVQTINDEINLVVGRVDD
jgi:guanylate kinase